MSRVEIDDPAGPAAAVSLPALARNEDAVPPAAIRTVPRSSCYLCGKPGNNLYEGLTDGLFGVAGSWNLRKCSDPDCRLIWLDPMPAPEDTGKLYESYYTHEPGPQSPDRSPGLLVAALTPGGRLVAHPASLVRRKRVRQHERRSNHVFSGLDLGRDVLEVGSGEGRFLNFMRGRGHRVTGVDPDAKACKAAEAKYGMAVHCGTMEDAAFPAASFDAVMMNHVVEHLPDPLATLDECRRVLGPGGKLVMVTPNHASIGHGAFGSSWVGLDPPRHLHLFDPGSLEQLAVRAGFAQRELRGLSGLSYFFFRESWMIARKNAAAAEAAEFRNDMRQKASRMLQSSLLRLYESLAVRGNQFLAEEIALVCRNHAKERA